MADIYNALFGGQPENLEYVGYTDCPLCGDDCADVRREGKGGEAMSGIYDTFKGSITGEVLTFNPDAIPEPDTLFIRMTRGERRIADELRRQFGGFKRVVIDVDGEQHEFNADSLIRLLEDYEDASRWHELFGTPERAARTLARMDVDACNWCVNSSGNPEDCKSCPYEYDYYGCYLPEKFSMLEWLRGDAE